MQIKPEKIIFVIKNGKCNTIYLHTVVVTELKKANMKLVKMSCHWEFTEKKKKARSILNQFHDSGI